MRIVGCFLAVWGVCGLCSCASQPPRFQLTGVVQHSGGEPAAGCSVLPAAPGVSVPEMNILTALDGSFTWIPLPAGTYSVDVECWDPPGGRGHASDVELDQDRTLTITVR